MYINMVFDALIVLAAISMIYGGLKVWWAYVITGELMVVFGASMVFHYCLIHGYITDPDTWYFIYANLSATAVLLLTFCLTKPRFILIYVLSGMIALSTGVLVAYGNDDLIYLYPWAVGILDVAKVVFMAAYWQGVDHLRPNDRMDRVHVCQR